MKPNFVVSSYARSPRTPAVDRNTTQQHFICRSAFIHGSRSGERLQLAWIRDANVNYPKRERLHESWKVFQNITPETSSIELISLLQPARHESNYV
jgi:hypothetical protein